MHIPDGFLSTPVWGGSAVISAGYLILAVRRLKKAFEERLIPVMGVLGAFIFAAQMLNFPVVGGTSGHLLGGVLAAVVVGPTAGAFVLAIVLVVQCLIFQDGGLTALGANILNISVVGTMGGYAIYSIFKRYVVRDTKSQFRLCLGYAVSSWASVILASGACALELGISGTAPLRIVLPAMLGIHALIGIGEAIITVLVLSSLRKIRPDIVAH